MALVSKSVLERSKASVVYLALFVLLSVLVMGVYQGGVKISELQAETIALPDLPLALFLSFIRMFVAYWISIVFAFVFGLIAARSSLGEKFVLPVLDILQSVPVVGFFPAAITFFIGVTQGHRMGVELSAVFLIFTSLAWNLAFAVYEAVRAIPQESQEAVECFGLRSSHRFLKLYLPASIPRMVYNSILSWSNGWFFLVACEIIAVGPVKYNLPGIGSFLARAAEEENVGLVLWGLLALSSLIIVLDFFIWKPLMVWSERFKQDSVSSGDDETEIGQFLDLPKTLVSKLDFLTDPIKRLFSALVFPLVWMIKEIILPLFWDLPSELLSGLWRGVSEPAAPWLQKTERVRSAAGYFALGFLIIFGFLYFLNWLKGPFPSVMQEIPKGLFYSTLRIFAALGISFSWIIPLIYFSWNKPRFRNALTTVAQLGASLPATALFPLIVLVGVRKLGGGLDFATLVLLTFGIQWYVLFNALGGVATIPSDLADATRSYGLSNWATFKKLVFPAIRPALITGAITAWGGGWNALVVSEYMTVKDEVLKVDGLGSLLSYSVYELGDGRAITMCIVVMVAWILMFNLLMWQPLYRRNLERYRL